MSDGITELTKMATDPASILAVALAIKGGLWSGYGVIVDQLRSALKDKSMQSLADHVDQEVKRLDKRIDIEGCKTNEFFELFRLTADAAAATTRDEKIQVLAKLLANQTLCKDDPEKLTYSEAQHFMLCVDALSVEAIETLGKLTKIVKSKQVGPAIASAGLLSGVATSREIYAELPELDPALVMGLVSQLQVWNLAYIAHPVVREVDQGVVLNDDIHVEPLGVKLVAFITGNPKPPVM